MMREIFSQFQLDSFCLGVITSGLIVLLGKLIKKFNLFKKRRDQLSISLGRALERIDSSGFE